MSARRPLVYLTPDGASAGTYAGWRRRTIASTLDWAICVVLYLIASIPTGILQLFDYEPLEVAAEVLAVAPVVVYFAYYLRTGATLGMRAADIETVVAETGESPGWPRAVGRALAAFLFGAASYVCYFAYGSFEAPLDRPSASTAETALVTAATAMLAVNVISKLWFFADPRRQTLQDKAFGLIVVEDLASTAPEPSPWSGLWHRAP